VGIIDRPLTPDEDAKLDAFCGEILTRDGHAVSVTDESVYAYLTSTATRDERSEVEDALFKSSAFCQELLAVAEYVDHVHGRFEAAEQPPGIERRRIERGWKTFVAGISWLLRRPHLAVAGAVVVAAFVIGAIELITLRVAPYKGPAKMHLAILPIECVGEGIGDQTFCDGLSETMTGKLSQLERFYRSFWVVPSDAVTKRKVSDPLEAEKLFGVTLAVTGSLQRLAGRFNLTLNLINLTSSPPQQLGSAAITGPLSNLTALQAATAHKIAEMLKLPLEPGAREALTAGDTDVPGAYRSYVEGRGYLQRYEDVENLENAIQAFEKAIEQDSLYAPAYAGLGEAYWRMFRARRDTELVRRAADLCRRALELNSDLAPIHVMLGEVRSEMGEYEEAISAFQRALEIDSTASGLYNGLARTYARLGRVEDAESTYVRAIRVKPDYWGGYNDLGYFYYTQGRFAEAAREYTVVTQLTPDNYLAFSNRGAMYYYLEQWEDAEQDFLRSIEIEPSGRAYINLASIYYIQARYEEAAELCRKALEINDKNYRTWATLANCYYWIPGRRDEAFPAYRRAIELAEERLELNPRDARMLVTLAGYYVMVGENEKALSYTERALQISSDKPIVLYFAGYVYEQLGQRDKALELIGRAIELGYPVEEIERDPWLSDLRADERFQELLLKRE
jgi:tetratricopeptide (TPR) repeat protein/TolB-like protein